VVLQQPTLRGDSLANAANVKELWDLQAII